jgi:hypothetical protein
MVGEFVIVGVLVPVLVGVLVSVGVLLGVGVMVGELVSVAVFVGVAVDGSGRALERARVVRPCASVTSMTLRDEFDPGHAEGTTTEPLVL